MARIDPTRMDSTRIRAADAQAVHVGGVPDHGGDLPDGGGAEARGVRGGAAGRRSGSERDGEEQTRQEGGGGGGGGCRVAEIELEISALCESEWV